MNLQQIMFKSMINNSELVQGVDARVACCGVCVSVSKFMCKQLRENCNTMKGFFSQVSYFEWGKMCPDRISPNQ